MEAKSLLEGIKSKFIIRTLFSLLIDIKKYKIVIYSKLFQNILNLNLQKYKEKCFEPFQHINFLSLLSNKNDTDSIKKIRNFDIKSLENKLNEELIKNKIKRIKYDKVIQEYIETYFTKIYNDYKSKEEAPKKILDNQLIIDIYSPIYKLLLKKDILDKLFILRIPLPLICKKKLMNEYYNVTDLLYEQNPNFASFYCQIFGYNDESYLQYFKDYCKYFKQVKKFIIEINGENGLGSFFEFPTEIFKFENIKNNLIVLDLKCVNFGNWHSFQNSETIGKNLKELNSLEELRLEGFKKFHLDNINLKYLYVSNCDSIILSKNCFANMEIINLFRLRNFDIDDHNKKIKLPNLVKFKVSFCGHNCNEVLNYNLFDLTSCSKLKYYLPRIDLSTFLSLGETLLEKVYISTTRYDQLIDKQSEINMIQKLLEIKTLKEIKIEITQLIEKDIELIKGENLSVEKLIVVINPIDGPGYYYNNAPHIINLCCIQKKFPNLKEFQVYHETDHSGICNLEINPDSNSKIIKIKFSECGKGDDYGYDTKFNIAPYEDLISIEFGCMETSFKYEQCLPLFKEKCDSIFKSLKEFKFVSRICPGKFDLKFITNIINNIDKMPNLNRFVFIAKCKIDEVTFKKIMEKLLFSDVKNIELCLNPNVNIIREYSVIEIENLFKGIDIKKFEEIKITKI